MIGIIDQTLQATLLGGLYAMFALGLAISVGVLRFINVAHGDIIVLMSFLMLSLSQSLGIPVPLALVILIPAGAAFGWLLQRGILERAVSKNELQLILITFGLSTVIQNGLLEVYGADTRKVTAGGIELASLKLVDGLSIGVLPLLIFAVACLLIVGLEQILYKTNIGVRIRAVADDPTAARLVGLSVPAVFAIAMALVGVTEAISGGLMSIWTNFDPASGPTRLLIAFEVVVLAGLGSFWGVLAGGIIIAYAQTFGGMIDSAWQVLGGHIVFLVLFLTRPQGLFPKH
ncbi:branched-chain amino acid ABC transporter permease [Shinella sumterensis]|uniref:Branched-chain amino acid ABC transporter permease n=1 Tax=Shinella sumterensis TaxID=1967501 RepID=A0AA50CRC9_9HYPH|nr:branched-chain amino acid ABC transporter permease [Shinella sumterensis]WLS00671.1 branched-chain amino acid ABC transporter permease [Shinella sumterensis]